MCCCKSHCYQTTEGLKRPQDSVHYSNEIWRNNAVVAMHRPEPWRGYFGNSNPFLTNSSTGGSSSRCDSPLQALKAFALIVLCLTAAPATSQPTQQGSCPAECKCSLATQYKGMEVGQSRQGAGGVMIDCSDSNLTTWRGEVPLTTVVFVLDRNKIRSVPVLSSSSSELEALSVKTNLVFSIPDDAFRAFRSLRWLDLADNMISDLGWTAAFSDKDLEYLDLSHNDISSLERLAMLPSVRRLTLSHNHITTIARSTFHKFRNLKQLDLGYNALSVGGLQRNCFERLTDVSRLSLAGNRPLARIPDFVRLGLEWNSVRELDLHGLTLLTEVRAFAFDKLASLGKLNLSRCSIDHLEQGWLNGGPQDSLQTLDLSFNRIQRLQPYSLVAIAAKKKLTEPGTYTDLRLDPATLPYVVSSSVMSPVQDIQPLNSHNLNDQALGPEWYRPLAALRWISLAHNDRLTAIEDDAFAYLPKLEYLFLQSCNLSTANLATSKFRYDAKAIHKTLPSIRAMWLYENPFLCDCYVREVKYALKAEEDVAFASPCYSRTPSAGLQLDPGEYFYEGDCVRVPGASRSVCYSPANGLGSNIVHVPLSNLMCPNEPLSLFVVIIIGPLMFLAAIGVVMLCGLCTVCVKRGKRHRAGKYQVMSEKQALIDRDQSNRSNGRRSRASSRNASPRLEEKATFGTNLALGGFNRNQPAQGLRFSIPSPFLNRRKTPSPSPSRSSKTLLEVPSRSYVETHLGGQVTHFSRSCSDVPAAAKASLSFWQHQIGSEMSRAPRRFTTNAQVNAAQEESKEPLIQGSGSSSLGASEYAAQEEEEEYKGLVHSILELPT